MENENSHVARRARAWVETLIGEYKTEAEASLAARERGLKLSDRYYPGFGETVARRARAWVETWSNPYVIVRPEVARRARAWVETDVITSQLNIGPSLAARERGLKLQKRPALLKQKQSRSPRASVG